MQTTLQAVPSLASWMMLSLSSLRPKRSTWPFLAVAILFLVLTTSPSHSSSSNPAFRFQRQPQHQRYTQYPSAVHDVHDTTQPSLSHTEKPTTYPLPPPQAIDDPAELTVSELGPYPHRPKSPSPITMIIMWNPRGGQPPSYLPNFFASVLANPTIDLLIIKHDRDGSGVDCGPMAPQNLSHSNIREVCFTQEEYFGRHAKWLCDLPGWTCSDDELLKLTADLIRFGQIDGVCNESFFSFSPDNRLCT